MSVKEQVTWGRGLCPRTAPPPLRSLPSSTSTGSSPGGVAVMVMEKEIGTSTPVDPTRCPGVKEPLPLVQIWWVLPSSQCTVMSSPCGGAADPGAAPTSRSSPAAPVARVLRMMVSVRSEGPRRPLRAEPRTGPPGRTIRRGAYPRGRDATAYPVGGAWHAEGWDPDGPGPTPGGMPVYRAEPPPLPRPFPPGLSLLSELLARDCSTKTPSSLLVTTTLPSPK
ncbi:hypothetical protein [Ornithinimicrobium kibberense]|uniref:hypothetical protein n=1 Tax=Ornithinimicrobium kibberense TaxID=282060 RepID=UPI00361CE31D